MSDPWGRPAGGPPEGRVRHGRGPEPPGPRSGSHDAGHGGRRARARGADPDSDGGGISAGHAAGAGRAADAPPTGGRAAARAAARGRGGSSARRKKGGSRAKRPSGGRRFLRIAAITVSLLVVVTAGAGWWFYQHLNGNLTSVSLTDGVGKDSAGTEKADAFGRKPINILVMGSDGRTSAEDCKLGGGCATTGVQTGENADVEMVLHISADRSNATVMSIPRDTEVDVPACTDPKTGAKTAGYHGMINSALAYGQACQVATVHKLTNIPIDHFIQVDFSGVVDMSDAVGGVQVCVSGDVYDTYSHLKLSKGTHTLKGVGALEFLRSRHGFGDGSDLGRTYAQHAFLSSLIRKFKSAGTLTNPTSVYKLANAATKALTVDTGLGTIKKLIGLAGDVNKVPTKRITFTTMQTAADPTDANRVVVGAGAETLFSTIADDKSLTTASGGKSAAATATASPTPTVPASQVTVSVQNGTAVPGRAGDIADALVAKGFNPATSSGNADPTDTTALTYGSGQKAQAQTVAKALGLPSSHLKQGTSDGVTLVIGSDWSTGTSFPGGTSSSSDTKQALADAHAETADKSTTCAQVSTYKTVEINGVPMTPGQAYAASPGKKDSDE
ncbi:putative transcriptional regulator [Actinacidiphila reveromycinica]|uniref:Putative transcriptional regulator n=1 Tax=Actinacidiphila reveromycinica TaxID=659352 RepID=A0A7U3USZ5_9ACTN|nr:LCP family protein [Streptomyces sp. SN-593]BBA98189.1 putative transcriptional regulator [Streptomyces sp. SN-593]